MHQTIKGITEDMEALRFNTVISKYMIYYNYLSKRESISRQEAEVFLKLLAPVAPFIAEELYQHVILSLREGSKDSSPRRNVGIQNDNKFKSIHTQPWPTYDEAYLQKDQVTIVVQVNGKVRDSLQVQSSKLKVQNEVEKMARESGKVKNYLEGKSVKNVIYIEGKIINFVVS